MNRLQELAQQSPALNDALHDLIQASPFEKISHHMYVSGLIDGLKLAGALSQTDASNLQISVVNMMFASMSGFEA